MQTVEEFAERHAIKFSATEITRRPDSLMTDMPRGTRHWLCALKREGASYELCFSQGPGIKRNPTKSDILNCMASDCSTVDQVADEFDFMHEFGYEDEEQARLVWEAILEQREGMERLLGKEILEELMYETERE